MAGKIKKMIDTIISTRAQGDPVLEKTIKTKLVLKGINPDSYGPSSPDDPAVIEKLTAIARDFNVNLKI